MNSKPKPSRSGIAAWPEEVYLQIQSFKSRAYLSGRDTRGGLETFSLLMLDFDYNDQVFDLDAVFYAHQLEMNIWSKQADPFVTNSTF